VKSRLRFVGLQILLVVVVLVGLDLAGNAARAISFEYEQWARALRADAVIPQEAPGPRFVAENLAWRYIEFYTMKPHFAWGREYRMDGFGLRASADGAVSFDRHDEQACRKVWFFGGSTTMGTGLPATSTLPALLQERLNARGGERFCVFNLGMASQESTQELLLFYEMLQRGFRPQVVIFYDGINEAFYERPSAGLASTPIWQVRGLGPMQVQAMNSASPLLRWRAAASEASGLVWLAQQVRATWLTRPATSPGDVAVLERQMATMMEHYRMNVRLLRGMATDLGIRAFFFWQPAMSYDLHAGRRALTERERVMWDEYGKPDEHLRHVAFARHRATTSFEDFPVFDVSDVFAGVREQVYMDPRHPNSRGNALIADRLHAVLAERL